VPKPTPIQFVQIAILSVLIFVLISVAIALIVYGVTVATGMWTDRP
jgi:hypothetical protein